MLSDHLINIFKLYGYDFNYNLLGISIRNGGFYYKRMDKSSHVHYGGKMKLSIEDPLNPSQNIARATYRYERVIELFQK